MSVRRFSGLQTLTDGAVFWTDLANEHSWRIQYNKTLDLITPLKPFRLIDPEGVLWASADSAEELAKELPNMVAEFATKDPMVNKEMLQKVMVTLATTLVTAMAKGAVSSYGPGSKD